MSDHLTDIKILDSQQQVSNNTGVEEIIAPLEQEPTVQTVEISQITKPTIGLFDIIQQSQQQAETFNIEGQNDKTQ